MPVCWCEAVPVNEAEWEQRLRQAGASIDQRGEAEFVAVIEQLTAALPSDNAIGLFEQASAFDSTGHPDLAAPLYRQALAGGLAGERRRRAVIQLASSLRNLGQPEESETLLTAELEAGSDHLDDAVRAFLALALVDLRQEREAVSLLLAALARHLSRYQRSVANYATLLVEADQDTQSRD
jgi:thioredoxin-like negative regulator of GroEL